MPLLQFMITKIVIIILSLMGLVYFSLRPSSPQLPTAPLVKTSSPTIVESPDGKARLTMKKTISNSLVNYTFSIDKPIFSKTIASTNTISIPFNTWSPDNKYIFLKENLGQETNYNVLSVSGKELINVSGLFRQKYPDLKLVEITGWAAPTLLVLNTQKSSFWFNVTNQSFILLSSL